MVSLPVKVFLQRGHIRRPSQSQHQKDPRFLRAQVVGADRPERLKLGVARVKRDRAAGVYARCNDHGDLLGTRLPDGIERAGGNMTDPEALHDESAEPWLL